MDFEIPGDIKEVLRRLDAFIQEQIKPLEQQNLQFFDHRREWARTNWDDGTPRQEWEDLLAEMQRRADAAGFLRWGLPQELGGSGGSNLGMAIIREHLAAMGLGLHNDLQNESSIVGNFPIANILHRFASGDDQKALVEGIVTGRVKVGFGLTEPNHGSDATWLETTGRREGDGWVLKGAKRFNSRMHNATYDLVLARTGGSPGDPDGITAFLVPVDATGFLVEYYHWTFNMPTDHAEVALRDVRVPSSAIVGTEGGGLAVIQHFVHENRIRQAAASLGAAQHCIDASVEYARRRVTFGKPLAERQAIQWPLVELHTEAEMVRNLVYKAAWLLDRAADPTEVSERVSMANYRANRLVCDAADRAMQVHGGIGYTRALPFEHIYRHHRRYRITEGAEEIQIRRIAGGLFGYAKAGRDARDGKETRG